jgi:hypothetical protein
MEYHTDDEYRTLARDQFPEEMRRGLLLATGNVYKRSLDHTNRNIERREHDGLGHWRREKMQDALMGVANRYEEEYNIQYVGACNSNGSSHFSTIISPKVRLICCLAPGSRKMVRPARIRKMFAANNLDSQCWLMEEMRPPAERYDDRYLAILLHGPAGKNRGVLGFCDIVFPSQNFSGYMGRIQLFEEFASVVRENPKLFRVKRSRGAGAA